MDNDIFTQLFELIKIFKTNQIKFPDYGTQNFHKLASLEDNQQKFDLLINRKGHLREDILTYQMSSKKYGIMVRLDMSGSPHDDRNGSSIDTPHVHIFDEEHNNGKWAVPLSEISDDDILFELRDSLLIFLKYNNVNLEGITIPMI